MINFPESLPFLGLASNNCTYTTSHNRKKDLLQIFFHRPSFNNNFCFIYFPMTYHVKRVFSMCIVQNACDFVCSSICLLLVLVFSFSPLLYSLQWKCMCVFVLLILAVLPLLFCLMLFVLFFDLLYFSAKFSIFTSDVLRLSLYLLLLVYILSDT